MSTVIVRALARPLEWGIVALSLFLLVRGHDEPGGGFAGGLVAGAALALARLVGEAPSSSRSSVRAGLLATGLLIVVGYGVAGLALGAGFLGSAVWRVGLPILGEIKIVASLIFDVGVYLIVVAMVAIFLRVLEEGR